MIRPMSKAISLLVLLVAFVALSAIPASADPSVCVNVETSQINSPHTATANSWGGTRLNYGDRVMISQAVVDGGPTECRALESHNPNSIFIPWKTPKEWAAFLTAAPTQGIQVTTCCKPWKAPVCSENHVTSDGQPGKAALGYRYLGVPLKEQTSDFSQIIPQDSVLLYNDMGAPATVANMNLKNWGAQGDIYGPICASNMFSDSTINYEVTYTCINEAWVNTREIGSCTPLDGDCSSLNGTTMSVLPSDTQELCIKGSIIADLKTVSDQGNNLTGWTWTCKGTPGRSDKSCAATFQAKQNGVCGSDNGTVMSTLIASDLNLCSVGGLAPNSFVKVMDSQGKTVGWTWSCAGVGGGTTATCAATKGTTYPACGPAYKGSFTAAQMASKTKTDLCLSGNNSSISLGGIDDWWSWTCSNSLGSVDCWAGNPVVDGGCGSDASSWTYNPLDTPPGGDLCYDSRSSVIGFAFTMDTSTLGHWSWQCSGINGGATSPVCKAKFDSEQIDAECGPADGNTYSLMTVLTPGLCSAGTPGAPYTYSSYWLWTCYGIHGGSNADCGAYNNQAPGSCGAAGGGYYDGAPPTGDLCDIGTASSVVRVGNTWVWTCQGSGLTIPTSCTSYALNGSCGDQAGVTTIDQPSGALCDDGTASVPTLNATKTRWKWTCSTTYGSPASCSANAANASCGSAKDGLFATSPNSNLCAGGTSTTPVLNSGASLWQWNCSAPNGTSTACSAYYTGAGSSFVEGTCGPAIGQTTSSPPTTGLCSAGTPSTPTLVGSNYKWTCAGAAGGGTATCTSSYSSTANDGTCGTANGVASSTVPSTGLCATGTASTPAYNTGFTNWTWTCASSGAGATANCTAPVTTANGSCGFTNGTYIPNQPNNNLCSTGVPSTVTTNAPWTWTCYGVGGGNNSPTCQANQCSTCAGTKTVNQSMGINGTVSGCTITANVTWTETDSLAASGGAGSYNITWTDALGNHSSNTILPSTITYCQPCYANETGFTTPVVTIATATGSCSGYTVGSTLPVSNAQDHH